MYRYWYQYRISLSDAQPYFKSVLSLFMLFPVFIIIAYKPDTKLLLLEVILCEDKLSFFLEMQLQNMFL